jgi:tetratricopeptide (TPR) repeat protein
MEIEIELRPDDLSTDLHSLRDYLEQHVEGLRLQIRLQPATEGKMGDWEEALGMGMMHGIWAEVGKIGIELSIKGGKKIYSLVREWQQQNKQKKIALGTAPATAGPFRSPGITMGDGATKIYITEDDKGQLQVFDNFDFAINTRHTYALLIGNSEFGGNFPSIPPVRNNLIDFYNLLVDKRHIGLPRENVEVKLDLTSNEIEELMLKMSRTANMETLMIYYSGHGHKADRESLVLTARNTKKIDDDIIGGVDFNFITEKVLKRSTASQKIVIIDACHSGLAAQGDLDPITNFDVKGTYILTSSGDEASYFEKKARNTFFTGTLLNLLSAGINDETKEMMSLEDLYKLSFQKLTEDKFPEPHFKSQLNIAPSLFQIARNPRFSVEKLKLMPLSLLAQGRTEEALERYKDLVRRFPDDNELRRKKDECEDIVKFTESVNAGDALFFGKKDYQGAMEKYRLALTYRKDDLHVINKVVKCKELIASSGVISGPPPPAPRPEPPKPPVPPPAPKPPVPPPVIVDTKETYAFNDQAAIVSFKDDPSKQPIEIPYGKIREFTYSKIAATVLVSFNNAEGRHIAHRFLFTTKEQALQLKDFLVQKTGIKKKPGQGKTPEIIIGIVIWGVICVAYIGLTNWAKGDKDEKGIGKIIVDILTFIGSIITPIVAVIVVVVIIILIIIDAFNKAKKNPEEVYSR